MNKQPNNPLHGITLEQIVNALVEHYGWGELGIYVRIKCFNNDPSVKSSLKFLRKTPWARSKVENLYLTMLREIESDKEKESGKKTGWPYSNQQ